VPERAFRLSWSGTWADANKGGLGRQRKCLFNKRITPAPSTIWQVMRIEYEMNLLCIATSSEFRHFALNFTDLKN
jgi:hypothetical protein